MLYDVHRMYRGLAFPEGEDGKAESDHRVTPDTRSPLLTHPITPTDARGDGAGRPEAPGPDAPAGSPRTAGGAWRRLQVSSTSNSSSLKSSSRSAPSRSTRARVPAGEEEPVSGLEAGAAPPATEHSPEEGNQGTAFLMSKLSSDCWE